VPYRITGLSPEPFRHLFGLCEEELATRGARRYRAEPGSTLPDRIELRDARPGETLLLVNHMHQSADTPFRASHAIFVLEQADAPFDSTGVIPQALATRMLSLRAFDAGHMMVDADLIDGSAAERLIRRMFADPAVDYIQAHYARRGCYAARIERA
jgi:hypothetical protein